MSTYTETSKRTRTIYLRVGGMKNDTDRPRIVITARTARRHTCNPFPQLLHPRPYGKKPLTLIYGYGCSLCQPLMKTPGSLESSPVGDSQYGLLLGFFPRACDCHGERERTSTRKRTYPREVNQPVMRFTRCCSLDISISGTDLQIFFSWRQQFYTKSSIIC